MEGRLNRRKNPAAARHTHDLDNYGGVGVAGAGLADIELIELTQLDAVDGDDIGALTQDVVHGRPVAVLERDDKGLAGSDSAEDPLGHIAQDSGGGLPL